MYEEEICEGSKAIIKNKIKEWRKVEMEIMVNGRARNSRSKQGNNKK